MGVNKKPAQKSILSIDVDVKSGNLTEDIESNKTTETTNTETFVKSRRRTSLSEFATVNNLRPEFHAGFAAWLKGDVFHFDEEWEELYDKYKNR